ncbi:neuron navigator 2 isoform X2 [Astyanax mexicanus]|uniref:neuron navigator 2 isoform X2 n=1 Tax=Astyanax mexicanus TaxID=7994 RepID=UPI0020CB0CA4|nr:neuron navigator 2 isoform X2 [Astyanax mexicanus]
MPAILVTSTMKSGLPKPVHSALPIPQSPSHRRTGHNGSPKLSHPSLIPLRSTLSRRHSQTAGATLKKSQTVKEKIADPQIYTDWANHYLAKSGHKRMIRDLQQDVADGVLLAEIIQVVANEKIADINGYPESRSQMIGNIDACLAFLAAKGVNIKGFCAEEIRSGNLKAILGLFFSLSRFKQQQQQQQKHQQQQQEALKQTNHDTQSVQQTQTQPHRSASPAQHCPIHSQPQQTPSTLLPSTQGDMQSSHPSRRSSQSKSLRLSVAQKKSSRLPGPSVRAGGSGSEAKLRKSSSSSSSSSRRSQSFNHCDKTKTAAPAFSLHTDKSPSPSPIMVDEGPPNSQVPPPTSISGSTSTSTKGWRSKSLNAKHSATSSMLSVKQPSSVALEAPPKVIAQKSMLDKLKLFNSRPSSRASSVASLGDPDTVPEEPDGGSVCSIHPEAQLGNQRPNSTSPKLALKGIAQRTLSRALAPKISSAKAAEKDKDKGKQKGKEKSAKRSSGVEQDQVREETRTVTQGLVEVKKSSSIPKGTKGSSSAKKDASSSFSSSQSGIPKPGHAGKTPGLVKASVAPPCGGERRDGERTRNLRTGGTVLSHKCSMESKNSGSTSSLASSDGRCSQNSNSSIIQSTTSVQLPQPQPQYSHPNTATVAPFMYRSQTDMDKTGLVEGGEVKKEKSVLHSKSIHTSLESLTGEDPESRRLRTVKNIADLRQNLEETMSSLRHMAHISHSTLETTFDACVTTEINTRGLLALSPRPASALPWRLGSSSPRLQAGDAPSLGSGYGQHSSRCRQTNSTRTVNISELDVSDKVEELEGMGMDTTGYMSDGDVLGKSVRTDSATSGYMTDGGLSLYTRRLNRVPDSTSVDRDTPFRSKSQADTDSWDDSSSVSSGVSDALDTDELNTSSSLSSYINTPSAPRRDLEEQVQTDAEKRSIVERSTVWSTEDLRRPDGCSEPGMKMDTKWCSPTNFSEQAECAMTGHKSSSISHTGSWRRGMSAQVGVTCPRTKAPTPTNCSSLKTHGNGKTDDAKVSERGSFSPRPNGLPRSPSERQIPTDEGRKLPSSSGSSARAPTNTFGFKKTSSGTATITASGAVITSGSATLGKLPKSSGFTGIRLMGRQNSVDDGYLPPSARTTLQYRSLPRPSRTNSSLGTARHTSSRPAAAGMDASLISKGTSTLPNPKSRGSVRSPSGISNQTDREKGVLSDAESLASGLGHNKASGSSQLGVPGQGQSGRQTGGKYPDMSSPTLRRIFGGKPGTKQAPVTTSENMKNSTIISNPHAAPSKQGGSTATAPNNISLCGETLDQSLSSLTSNPGSAFSAWGGRDSSCCTSTDSIDVSMSKDESLSSCLSRAGSIRTGLSERYGQVPQGRGNEEARDWLRSHSAAGLQDSAPFSPASTLSSPSAPRFNFTTIGSPGTAPQINLRTPTSLANQDGMLDPLSDPRLRNSSVSLEEKSRTMSSSGSFREVLEEVHGSSLSLVSNTSSVYSTPEEKSQSEIRKLRRELESSQEKVSTLTNQLSANAHLVAAFEQSLGNMTIRLQSLTLTAEQKDTELNDLRKTIELLKKQNTAAQAAISEVINTPDAPSKDSSSASSRSVGDLRIHRQHSSDSVSSITSATSHSSVGSSLELDAKNKKKRKNWLRSSFKQAFGKKKSPKSASSHSDIEEMTDSSMPSSPRLPYCPPNTAPLLRHSHSNSLPLLSSLSAYGSGWGCNRAPIRTTSLARISECADSDAETVMQLRSELRDKEMKLTDIRLEALSSAHQLDQFRESMNRMQLEIEKLKSENDRLRMDSRGSCSTATSQTSISPSSIGLSSQLSLTESTSLDMLLDDSGDGSSRKEGQHVKVVVSLERDHEWKEDCRPHNFLLGCIGVSGKTKWEVLDGVVRRLFKEYIIHVDPLTQLGLNSDSVFSYSIGDVHRTEKTDSPELLPCGYLVGDSNTISVRLKGVAENSQDELVFETLIPKPILQRYLSQLREHRRIILSGPSGTGKSFLATRLAEHLVLLEGRTLADRVIASFNVDNKSSKELKQYLSNLTDQCNNSTQAGELPLVVILDNLHHVGSLGEIFNGLLNCKKHRCPYIIGTMNQTTPSTPNLQLHHNFRWVLCANHTEPVSGFLGRFLRRKLLETEISSRVRNAELVKIIEWIPCVWQHLNRFLETHSSSDVTIGPRLFLSCPMDVEGSQVWFTDLWNYSIIPYLLEAVREGLQLYGRKASWEDPARWVTDSYPWASSPQQHQWPPLLQLRPEDVGFDGYALARENSPGKQAAQDGSEGDPLMNMLMRLKEAAHCTGTSSYDSDSNSTSNHDDVLDPSLESAL